MVFIAFCAASSAGYLINDLRDAELDRKHPIKQHRPIASGALRAGTAQVAATVLAIAALLLGALIGPEVVGIVVLYGTLTIGYTNPG